MVTQPDLSSNLPLLPPARELSAALTNREVDVLLLLAQRLSNKEIASRLSLSPNTVKKHSINLYDKLGVRSRRQAVTRAQALGLLPEGL
jgi:LuxR family maltose regulon positive regulatory protein